MERFVSQQNIERYRKLLDHIHRRTSAPDDMQIVGRGTRKIQTGARNLVTTCFGLPMAILVPIQSENRESTNSPLWNPLAIPVNVKMLSTLIGDGKRRILRIG